MENQNDGNDQIKVFNILVNTRPKAFTGKEISFREVVLLAWENAEFNGIWEYTVSYSKGEDKKPKGTLTDGSGVHLKEGMVFDVERAYKS